MDPLSIGMVGTNLLGGILSSFGKTERKVEWDTHPMLKQYQQQYQSAYRNNLDQAQAQANLGSFLDSKRNMTALNAGMGNLMQSGGAYSGAQMRAVGAMNAANKAQNYEGTLQGQAQAGQMRTAANNELTRNVDNASTYMSANITHNPDFMSRLGSALSGVNNSVLGGLGAGQTANNMLMNFGGGELSPNQQMPAQITQAPMMSSPVQRPQMPNRFQPVQMPRR